MILSVTLLGLLWGVVVARVPTLWRDPRQRAFWAVVVLLALIKTVVLLPHPAILPNLLGVLTAYFLLRFLSLLTGRGTQRWHLALTAAVLAALLVLAALTDDVTLTGDLSALTVAYWIVLEGFLGAVLVTTARMFWAVAPDAPAGLPRLGLRAIATGCALVALYAAIKTGLIVARGTGLAHIDFAEFKRYAMHLQGGGILIAVAGACVPAARRSRDIIGAYWSLLVLRPLWKAMRDAFPEVILFSPRRAVFELAGVDDVQLRLYRRVIEIRDGMLALRPYLPETPPHSPDPADAEAAAIVQALRRRADGLAAADQPAAFAGVGPEMADEVAWLSRVSRAYRHGPVTAAARTPRPSGSAR
ncbi:MAB_1171c family putative transporter [Paractinoplanes durhamensis]|uniref:MAB_1171c family putative transporter n=1 Tax=Paractinoplanes durhamensis TaxID=113563 RepID=UPI0031E036D2